MRFALYYVSLAAIALTACVADGTDGQSESGSEVPATYEGAVQQAFCSVSPNPVASGAALTISGKIGKNGESVSAYVYYSDGGHQILGGPTGSAGSFSISGTAVSWDSAGPAATGPATVQIYAVSPHNLTNVLTTTCSFAVD